MSQPSSSEPDRFINIKNSSIQNSQIGQAGRDLTQINIILSSVAGIGQLASESTSPFIRELFSQVLAQANYFLKRFEALKQAEKWLINKDFRQSLALNIANAALESKSLGNYLTPEAKSESKVDFVYNLYDCLCWLLEAFQTGIAKDLEYNFKHGLSQHPLECYVHALRTLKRRTRKDLKSKVVIKVIDEYIEMLIEKISFEEL